MCGIGIGLDSLVWVCSLHYTTGSSMLPLWLNTLMWARIVQNPLNSVLEEAQTRYAGASLNGNFSSASWYHSTLCHLPCTSTMIQAMQWRWPCCLTNTTGENYVSWTASAVTSSFTVRMKTLHIFMKCLAAEGDTSSMHLCYWADTISEAHKKTAHNN